VGSFIVLAGTYCGDRTWIFAPTREFLHVEDAAEGILLAAERYNERAGEPRSSVG
jgi:nucleoside-diphosphate-sugar epimerase